MSNDGDNNNNIIDLNSRRSNCIKVNNANSSKLIQDSSKIVILGAFSYACPLCKKIIYSMNATYDFKDLPPDLHAKTAEFLCAKQIIITDHLVHTACDEEYRRLKMIKGEEKKSSIGSRFRAWVLRYLIRKVDKKKRIKKIKKGVRA